MRVAVMGFGSVWRHRLAKQEATGRSTRPVYYNTTGVSVSGKVRQRPQICGYARFDTIGGFDPHHPSRMVGCVFDSREPSIWMGHNKILCSRLLNDGHDPDCYLVVARSGFVGRLPVGSEGWRSPNTWLLSLSESDGQQEAMLLMSKGDWLRSSLGQFVLESSAPGRVRLALHAGE